MTVAEQRTDRGKRAYFSGEAAEAAVARAYADAGYVLIETRWRGIAGEIDLIFGDGAARIFVEVKKSRTFSSASQRLSRKQAQRIFAAAQEYLAHEPSGLLTDVRIDVALMNAAGEVSILHNALMDD